MDLTILDHTEDLILMQKRFEFLGHFDILSGVTTLQR